MNISEERKVSRERMKTRLRETLPEAIRKSGLTQAEVAQYLGISKVSLWHYVKGDRLPSFQILANLCRLLQISPNYLMGVEAYSK